MNTNFNDKYGQWAVVTGASSGIGKEFAIQLRDKGLNIVLVARSEDQLQVVANSLGKNNTHVVVANLATHEGVNTLEEETVGLDIGLFVHSAGAVHLGAFVDFNEPDIDELIQVHVSATSILTQVFAQRIKKRSRGGGIVLLSSGFAFTPVPWVAVYAATKAYVLSFGEALSVELKNHNIDVMTVIPGGTRTNMASNIEKHIDLGKLPMPMGTAASVATSAINSLGKKDSVVPGAMNKIMALMMDRLVSRNSSKRMIGWMLRKAFRSNPIEAKTRTQS